MHRRLLRCSVALCAGLAPAFALTSHPRRAAATPSDPCGPRPQRRSGGGQGTTSLHARHDIGPASQHTHWHTPHPTPHRCVRGAFKGAIASACGRASPPRSRPSAAPLSRPSKLITPGQSPSCYSSRKLSVRARGSHRCTLRFGASRSRSNRTRLRAFDARRSALACIAARVPPAAQHAALRTGGGAGGTGRCRAISPSRAFVYALLAPCHITPAVGPD